MQNGAATREYTIGLFMIINNCEKNLAVYYAFSGRHPPTRRSKTANIT